MIPIPRRSPRSTGVRSSIASNASVLVPAFVVASVLAVGAAQAADSASTASIVPAAQHGSVGRQLWRLSDYTTVELVGIERGAVPNGHPWQVEPGALRQQLQQLKIVRAGADRPLFASDELTALVPALVEAFGNARPDQDIALVSAARHEDNTFLALSAVTARLFVVDGRLNIIVHDARLDFYDAARGTGVSPSFTVGSRKSPGSMPILSAGATSVRADWLALSAAAAPAPVVALPQPVPAPAAPQAAVAEPAPDAEQRLVTLKRLFDKGLITEAEYKQKRQEVLKGL